MFVFKPVTERVKAMRERYRTTVPKICIARYKLITDYYMAHPEQTGILKRAGAMKYIFENMPVRVEPGEIIVGAQGTTYRSCAIYPEYSIGSLPMEIKSGNVTGRKYDPYLIDKEDGDYILATADFWEKESMGAKMNAYSVDGFLPYDGSGTTTCSFAFAASGPVGHFCTGYNTALRKGFGAIKAEADGKMRKMEEDGIYGSDIEK